MTNPSANTKVAGSRGSSTSRIAEPAQAADHAAYALVIGAAFCLYLFSASVLQAGSATMHFGADAHLYAPIASGIVLDRVVRFHPVTVALAVVWMGVLKPLAVWISPQLLLKALFAAVGALGVWAAMSAFAAVMPRRRALVWGILYAASFGVWYFASIEESKIVTATLCATYIAIYLRLRANWTERGAALLTVVLLLACLNEIVSGLLVAIPVADALVRRGWDLCESRWIALHALVGPLALIILEGPINGWLIPEERTAEGASHFSMLAYYIAKNDYSLSTLYSFGLNWLFFNMAAPMPVPRLWVPGLPQQGSYFEPALANYFSSLAPACLMALLAVSVAVCALPRCRAGHLGSLRGIVAGLAAFTLLRGSFFFVFNPREPLLFTPAVTLAHLLIMGLPFEASRFPAKGLFLLLAVVLLLVTNGAFIVGQ